MCCSKCGIDCGKCKLKDEYGCLGCDKMSIGYWGEKCEIKQCCEDKELEHCGICPEFPCELLLDISYDTDMGDDGERLLNLKKMADVKREKKEKREKNYLLGASLGGMIGAIIGTLQGMTAAFVTAGFIIGTGIALLLDKGGGDK